jgi:hypothetical protein
MGYTTEFDGVIELDKPLTEEDKNFLIEFANSRRMVRKFDCTDKYGIEGEWYIKDESFNVLDQNKPPKTQPGLWCQWVPTDDGKGIEWDGNEKFYEADNWMKYLIQGFLAPKGYKCNGEILAQGEDMYDRWHLIVKNNKVFRKDEGCKRTEVILDNDPQPITKLTDKECQVCKSRIKCELATVKAR